MRNQQRLNQVKELIAIRPRNISDLAKSLGVSRHTTYDYIIHLTKTGFIKKPKKVGKNVILRLSIEKSHSEIVKEINEQLTNNSRAWNKHIFPSFKKSHVKRKRINLLDDEYQYRLAQINNLIGSLLDLQRTILHLRITLELKKKNHTKFKELNNRCIKLIKKIKKDTISIDKKHKNEILDFFTKNITGKTV